MEEWINRNVGAACEEPPSSLTPFPEFPHCTGDLGKDPIARYITPCLWPKVDKVNRGCGRCAWFLVFVKCVIGDRGEDARIRRSRGLL